MARIGVVTASTFGLVEAAHLVEKGHSVVVFDRAERVGGAWSTVNFGRVGTVDSAVHVLEQSDLAYAFLERTLNVRLYTWEPEPKYRLPRDMFGERFIPYTEKWARRMMVPRLRDEPRRAMSTYWEYYTRLRALHLRKKQYQDGRHAESIFRYFRRGTIELVERLESLIDKRDLDVRLGTEVLSIECPSSGGAILNTSAGREAFDQVVVTSSGGAPVIRDGTSISESLERRTFVHLHLLVLESTRKSFTFIRYIDTSDVMRVQDFTSHLDLEPESETKVMNVICVSVNPALSQNDEAVNFVVAKLRRDGLVESDGQLRDWMWSTKDVQFWLDEDLEFLHRSTGGVIRTVQSNSFSTMIERHSERWQNLSN